jgi:hypothetical protein
MCRKKFFNSVLYVEKIFFNLTTVFGEPARSESRVAVQPRLHLKTSLRSESQNKKKYYYVGYSTDWLPSVAVCSKQQVANELKKMVEICCNIVLKVEDVGKRSASK